MAGGRARTSGAVTVTGTSRAGMRSQAASRPVVQMGPGWASPITVRRQARQTAADIAAVGLAVASLVDDFNDNTVNVDLWPNSFGTYSETGGRARIACDAGYNAYSTALTYTLTESSIYLRAYPPAAGGATTEAWIQVLIKQQTSGTDLGFEISPLSGNLTMFSRAGFFDAGALAVTYDAAAHAWLRVRETGGTVYWETSPDASAWTVQRTLASPTWVTDPNLEFQLIAHRGDGTADYAEFDNVNTPPVVTVGAAATTAAVTATAAGGNATAGGGSLTVTATCSATGAVTEVGAGSTAVTAGTTAAGLRDATATGATTATAALSATGTISAASAATTTATATATAAGRTDTTGATTTTGAATLTGAGLRATGSTAATTAAASPTAVGAVDAKASAATPGAVILTASGTVSGSSSGDASLTSSAAATATGLIAATAAGVLTAAAASAANGVRGASSTTAATVTVVLGAAGAVAIQGTAATVANSSLNAAGACETTGSSSLASAALLTASGAIGAAHDDIDVTVGAPYSQWSAGAPQGQPWPAGEPQSSDWEVAAPW